MRQNLCRNTIQILALTLMALVSLVHAKDLEPELVTTTDGHYYAVEMPVTENRDNSGYLYPDYVTPFYGTTAGEPYIVVLGSNYDYKGGYLTVVAPSDNDRLYVTGYLYTNNTAGEYVDFKVYNGDISQTHSLILNGTTCNGQNATNQCLVSIDPITSSGNRVTFYYKTTKESSKNKETIRLTVYHIKSQPVTVNQTTGGMVSANKKTAKKGETVSLTATPASGYMIKGYTVKDADNNVVPLSAFTSSSFNSTFNGSANFTMPISAVSVTPAWTNDLTAAGGLFVNMRSSGSRTLNIPAGVKSFYIYDDGGKDGKCSMNASSQLTLNAPEGSELQLSGTGPVGQATLYYSKDGGGSYLPGGNIGTVYIGSNSTKLTYESIASSEDLLSNGFAIIATVVTLQYDVELSSVSNGYLSTSKATAAAGEVVTLTAHPNSNYALASISVMDASGRTIPVANESGAWTSGSTYTFTMPASNVTVIPFWTSTLSAAGGLYVNMPASGSKTIDVPEQVKSFKVYDDGGSTGVYSWNADGSLTLRVAEGKRLGVLGAVKTRTTDKLFVYDGTLATGNLLKEVGGSSETVNTIYSTGNVMTLYFKSEGGNTSFSYSGLELTVSVLSNASEYYEVNVADALGGVVTPSETHVAPGQQVLLTAVPAAGYLPAGVSVRNAAGRSVSVTPSSSNVWYNGEPYTYTFEMPSSNVTVTPIWSNSVYSRYLKVPASGTQTVDISGKIGSFKVYDDGGSTTCSIVSEKGKNGVVKVVATGGCYSKNANGKLKLNAPEGYLMQVAGTVNTKTGASLTIYDGSDEAATLLSGKSGSNASTGVLTTTGNVMTVLFNASGCSENECLSDGIDLTVTLIKPSYAAISFASVNKKLIATIDGAYAGADAIEMTAAISADAVVFDRIFSTNGNGYSTIVLPFTINGSRLEGVDAVLQFEGLAKDENGDTVVTVSYAWCREGVSSECGSLSGLLTGYTPYLVKVSSERIGVRGFLAIQASQTAEVRKGDWVFRGTLQQKAWEKGDPEIGKVWGFAATDEYMNVGDFAKVGPGGWIRPLRAYMAYEPVTGGSNGAGRLARVAKIDDLPDSMPVVIVNRDESGEEHTTTIGTLNMRTGEFRMLKDYDLKGRKLNSKPKARGAYYGKKVIKK